MVVNLGIALIMSAISGFFVWYPAVLIASIFDSTNLEEHVMAGRISLAVILVLVFVVIRRGVVAVAVAFALAIAIAGAIVLTGAEVVSIFITLAIALAIAIAGAGAVAVVGAVAGAVAGVGALAGAIAIAGVGAVAGARALAVAVAEPGVKTVAFLLTGLNIYLVWRAMCGDPRDPWIRSTAIAFAAWRGTSFRGANLTNADFTAAQLKCCDFRPGKVKQKIEPTKLICTCFNKTTKLDLSRPRKTLLANANVRDLLINPESGYNQDFRKADLRGAALAGANLENANLKQADLSEANLQGANLKNANLTEALAVGTNFTHAYLTSACLESWVIDPTTIFQNADCQFIYLREHPNELGSRERRPHDPDKTFAPGDFERLYTQLMHTVELLLKGGMNRDAFAAAFNTIVEDNPELSWDSIQSIEKKGPDVLVILEVPPETDKAQVEQTFDAAYVARLEAQVEAQALHAQDLKGIIRDLTTQKRTVMEFNAPTYGVAGEVQGDQTNESIQ
ncbi:MAG: pentapeptide repeat-containing protein [Spirulinaceae cyanobacterium]